MLQEIQERIESAKIVGIDISQLTDGYHTFDELYELRDLLFIALLTSNKEQAWRASKNADGSFWDGWFVAGIFPKLGKQITFHLPIKHWDSLGGIETHDVNPFYDGHTTVDIVNRFKTQF